MNNDEKETLMLGCAWLAMLVHDLDIDVMRSVTVYRDTTGEPETLVLHDTLLAIRKVVRWLPPEGHA